MKPRFLRAITNLIEFLWPFSFLLQVGCGTTSPFLSARLSTEKSIWYASGLGVAQTQVKADVASRDTPQDLIQKKSELYGPVVNITYAHKFLDALEVNSTIGLIHLGVGARTQIYDSSRFASALGASFTKGAMSAPIKDAGDFSGNRSIGLIVRNTDSLFSIYNSYFISRDHEIGFQLNFGMREALLGGDWLAGSHATGRLLGFLLGFRMNDGMGFHLEYSQSHSVRLYISTLAIGMSLKLREP